MNKKINDYVKYIFNLNNLKDEEMFRETTGNLHERFASYKAESLSDDDAYLKTINTLGDFDFNEDNLDDKYSYKPNWANISLMISLSLAILGTIALFLNQAISMVFIAVSISLYIGSAYYLYHLSKYVLKEEKNINKHNSLLKSMFVNLKTSFVFWNTNVSYWVSSIVMNIITLIVGYNIKDNISLYIASLFVIFILIFAIIFFVFTVVYKKLEKTYLQLTNEKRLKGYFNKEVFTEHKPLICAISTFLFIVVYFLLMMNTGLQIYESSSGSIPQNEFSLAHYVVFGIPAAAVLIFSFVDIFLKGKTKSII